MTLSASASITIGRPHSDNRLRTNATETKSTPIPGPIPTEWKTEISLLISGESSGTSSNTASGTPNCSIILLDSCVLTVIFPTPHFKQALVDNKEAPAIPFFPATIKACPKLPL